jgi:hypothetical protein
MPVELRQTILGDVRTIINDAWDFFAPPLIKFSIALFFFWYICGSEPFYTVKDVVINATSSWNAGKVIDFLDKYKLTSLLPIAALFLVAVFAYVVNRIIFGVAALLPLNIGYTGDRIERMIQEDPMMQKHIESFPPYSGYMLIDFALAKARSQKEEALLRNVDSLEKASSRNHSLFSFAKFLLFWTVACCVLSLTVSGATVFSYSRVNLLAFTVIVFGIYAASRYAKSLEYLGYAQVHIVRLMLMGDDYLTKNKPAFSVVYPEPKDESRRREERQMRIEYLRRQDWWFLSLSLMDWWEVLRYFRHYDPGYIKSDRRLLLQALLRNSTNILWFIMGALLIVILTKFSWWVGVVLFVGYVSITIVDCLLVTFLLGAVTIKLLITALTTVLPEIIIGFLPEKPKRAIETREDDQYRITVGAIRLVEAWLAIVLCRVLASHFFG